MAFNSIGGSVNRRRATMETLRRTTRGAAQVVRVFLEETYGGAIAKQCVVSYARGTVTIRAPVKDVAYDLTLRSGELSAVVRAGKFPLKQLVIN